MSVRDEDTVEIEADQCIRIHAAKTRTRAKVERDARDRRFARGRWRRDERHVMAEGDDRVAKHRNPDPRSASFRDVRRCAGEKNQVRHGACIASIEMDVSDYYDAVLPYYDASLANRGDLPFWDSIAKQWSVNRTLELGCGTGRITKVLSRYARVTAVDLLMAMIRHVPKKAERVVADLRCFAFATSFDLIILADDPLSHVT